MKIIKRLIKKYLQQSNDILYKYKIRRPIDTTLDYSVYSTKYKHTFFGYYDVTPYSNDNSKILAMATDQDSIIKSPKAAVIGYFNLNNHKFVEVDTTDTWCWQQGCRLMWFDDRSIIYNKVVNNNYGSVVYDIYNNTITSEFNFPIYDKNNTGTLALSLNFSRLHVFRPGYGYTNYIRDSDRKMVNSTDGIYLCDLNSGKKELLISMTDILSIDYDDRMDNAYHYVNHLKFFPDNHRFIFYHIWVKDRFRYSRAIFANTDGVMQSIIDTNTPVSHYTFKNNDNIIIFTKTDKLGYHLYHTNGLFQSLFSPSLKLDGHPTFIDNNNLLTDTYPINISRKQMLIKATSDDFNVIGTFYSPLRYTGEFRCDLHPRLSRDSKFISIDLPLYGGRKILSLKLQ